MSALLPPTGAKQARGAVPVLSAGELVRRQAAPLRDPFHMRPAGDAEGEA